jgi:hypothetical protein
MTRKKITLPGGATCVVRRITGNDFAMTEGEIPIPADVADNPKSPEDAIRKAKRQVENGVRFLRVALLCCCSPLTFPDGSRRKIVDRELDQIGEQEITIGELSDADAKAIGDEVIELTGIGKEAAQAARPFPAEQAATGDPGPGGQEVRPASVGPAAAAAA